MTIPENGSGIYCTKCDTDIDEHPDHMCGSDPIVMADENCLEPFLGWMGVVIPGRFRCKYCYSGVGRQHYECPKLQIQKYLGSLIIGGEGISHFGGVNLLYKRLPKSFNYLSFSFSTLY
jgi:hypothetical protein